jgi:glycine betaine/choline ABC-type transport system substrate-binding protein
MAIGGIAVSQAGITCGVNRNWNNRKDGTSNQRQKYSFQSIHTYLLIVKLITGGLGENSVKLIAPKTGNSFANAPIIL